MTNITNVTADGRYVCTGLYEDLSDRFAKVDNRIWGLDLTTGKNWTIRPALPGYWLADGERIGYHGRSVGDGTRTFPWVLLWRFHNGAFEGPRAVAYHRGSFQVQITHVHPRFSPDGHQILYVSDDSGYGNLYLIDTPDFDQLPSPPDT